MRHLAVRIGVSAALVFACGLAWTDMPRAQAAPVTATPTPTPTPLIIDTDIYSDVDDAGALAVANALADQGAVKLLAIMVDTPSRWGAPAVDAIDTYYHHGQIPVGARKPIDDSEPTTPYPRYLAKHFPNALKDGADAPDAVTLYRRVLAAQPDHSVVIDSIGLLTNLARLLDSPADHSSPLTGAQLVARKVKTLDVMGGLYPAGQEFNFLYDPVSAEHVVANWPTPMTFDGFEVGGTVDTGAPLSSATPASDPVRTAYAMYVGAGNARESWDPLTTYYAIEGSAGLLAMAGQGGENILTGPTAANAWIPVLGNARDEHYLVKVAPDAAIASVLNRLMIQPPIAAQPAPAPRHRQPRRPRRRSRRGRRHHDRPRRGTR